MAEKALNDLFIRNYPAPEKRVEIYDDVVSGFALRVTPTGHKSFVYRYRFGDKVKRYTIGSYSKIKLADARDVARDLSHKINKGIDPLEERRKKKNKPDPMSFAELAEAYKEKGMTNLKEKTRAEYIRIVDNELIPSLGKKPVKEISQRDIINLLDRKALKDKSPTMANRIRARLSRIFNFGMSRGLAESNPVSNTSKFEHGENKRDRVYSDKEIKKLWAAFEIQNEPAQSIFKMLLLTGQRKGETSKLRWSYIQDDVWTIPKTITKNSTPNEVPLSWFAKEVLNNIKPLTGDSKFVFESPVNKGEPMQDLKRAKENVRAKSKVKDFRPHDLRRTVATNLAKLKVDRTVLGKILNHKKMSGDNLVTAIYDRHDYLEEKRKALSKWADRLYEILNEKDEDSE
jgi:integrase